MLKLFHVDIESFAVAGAFVIFLMSLEMILDVEIFKNQGPIKEATLVPLVFPVVGRCRCIYYTTFITGRVCQYQYCNCFDPEYAMGLFCR